MFRDSIRGLSGLNFLSKAALQKMRSLEICLNYFDLHLDLNGQSLFGGEGRKFGPESWDLQCHPACTPFRRQSLFSKARQHHEGSSVDEWHRMCRLLQTIPPNQLKLSLTCDTAEIEIAEDVLRPISCLSRLREYALRLGPLYLPGSSVDFTPLLSLAESEVKRLTTYPFLKGFNFAATPTEIQLQILSHTSLVTPYDLIWGFNTPIASSIKSAFYEARTVPWYRRYPNFSDADCCGDCSPSTHICSCWTSSAAFSSTCTCWRFPLSFFLVSKRMKEQAEAIFYGQNHFRILSSQATEGKGLEIFNFLTWIPGNGSAYLKGLTWEMTSRLRVNWGSG